MSASDDRQHGDREADGEQPEQRGRQHDPRVATRCRSPCPATRSRHSSGQGTTATSSAPGASTTSSTGPPRRHRRRRIRRRHGGQATAVPKLARMNILVMGAGGVGRQRSERSRHGGRSSTDSCWPTTTSNGPTTRSHVSTTDGSKSARVDASSAADVTRARDARRRRRVLNACDPRLNPPIFDGAFAAGCTYLDMAMHLSKPHPERPYERRA